MSKNCTECGQEVPQPVADFVAERNDIIRGAKGLLTDLGLTPDVADILVVARFLAGESAE